MVIRIHDIPNKRYGVPGNASCPGCPEAMAYRYIRMALGDKVIFVVPAGCTSVIQGIGPKSGLPFPILNIVFASAASAAAGMSAALEVIGRDDVHVVVFAGDGGTSDIGFQAMSGAAERNDNIIYIVADNEAYMNTGIQRSGLTPYGAWTTTTWTGKREHKKNLPFIMIAHEVPYVATASVGYPQDFIEKLRKAARIKGFKYIHLHAPDPVGWRFDPALTVKVAQLAVKTGFWPLFEYEKGEFKLSPFSRRYRDPSKRIPIIEYIKLQGRYKHILDKPHEIKRLEEYIDMIWKWIDLLERSSKPSEEARRIVGTGSG